MLVGSSMQKEDFNLFRRIISSRFHRAMVRTSCHFSEDNIAKVYFGIETQIFTDVIQDVLVLQSHFQYELLVDLCLTFPSYRFL